MSSGEIFQIFDLTAGVYFLHVGFCRVRTNHTRGIYRGITLQRTSVSSVGHSYPVWLTNLRSPLPGSHIDRSGNMFFCLSLCLRFDFAFIAIFASSSGFLFRFQLWLLYLGCPNLGFPSSSILLWPFFQRSALLVNGPILDV